MGRFTSRKVAATVTTALAVVSVCRVAVLFFESASAVRAEREADAELLEACRLGTARGSSKMRAACLQARADRASPLVFKAVVRAVGTAWSEFAETVSTPFGVLTVCLFLLSGLVMPAVPWARALALALGGGGGDDDDDNERGGDLERQRHVICFAGEPPPRPGMRRRVARLLRGPSHGSGDALSPVELPRAEFAAGL